MRIAWAVKTDVGERWQLRANVLVGRQFGDGAASGLQQELRFQASYALSGKVRIGLEMFNDFNTTADTGNFDEQGHQFGPILKARWGQGWALNAGYLAGISDSANDGDWRFIIARNF